MNVIELRGGISGSKVLIGERRGQLERYVNSANAVVITDRSVGKLYRGDIPITSIIEIEPGEQSKALSVVERIYHELLRFEVDRSTSIVGIGGGVVCDITGFVASTYLRGLDFGFVSSTLLSQIDASVGGKNGVNLSGYKNIVGSFNQPRFVICDIEMLATLPRRELLNGFAEMMKVALISDRELFELLESRYQDALSLDLALLERMVYESVRFKAGIVEADEREQGTRRLLNFGHTLGHAVEVVGELPHGAAVGIGMMAAIRCSVERGLLDPDVARRAELLLGNLGLPTRFKGDRSALLDVMRKDKKREGGEMYVVLLKEIGEAVVERIALDELESITHDMC